jgi:hypothetical protein
MYGLDLLVRHDLEPALRTMVAPRLLEHGECNGPAICALVSRYGSREHWRKLAHGGDELSVCLVGFAASPLVMQAGQRRFDGFNILRQQPVQQVWKRRNDVTICEGLPELRHERVAFCTRSS